MSLVNMIYFTLTLFIYSLLPFVILATYDDRSCAYFSTHVVATPLTTCSAYSYSDIQYSWNFVCDDSNHVQCNYFDGDTECTETLSTGLTGVDSIGSTVQCKGSGSNCHTVDIKVNGFTDAENDSCDDENDFFSFSFVIDECIPSILDGTNYSAILSCDAEKLYFEYYTGCLDCICEMETYTYEYYNDFDGCWEVLCGTVGQSGVGSVPITTPEPEHQCKNLNSEYYVNKLKQMLAKPMDLTKAKFVTSQKKIFTANVLNGNIERSTLNLSDKVMMNWMYIVILCVVILLGGTWNLIKEKEYSII